MTCSPPTSASYSANPGRKPRQGRKHGGSVCGSIMLNGIGGRLGDLSFVRNSQQAWAKREHGPSCGGRPEFRMWQRNRRHVEIERQKALSTVALTLISDDIVRLPLDQFEQVGQLAPDAIRHACLAAHHIGDCSGLDPAEQFGGFRMAEIERMERRGEGAHGLVLVIASGNEGIDSGLGAIERIFIAPVLDQDMDELVAFIVNVLNQFIDADRDVRPVAVGMVREAHLERAQVFVLVVINRNVRISRARLVGKAELDAATIRLELLNQRESQFGGQIGIVGEGFGHLGSPTCGGLHRCVASYIPEKMEFVKGKMTNGDRLVDLRQLAFVQHLHQQRYGATDLTFALFPFANRAKIADAQSIGQNRLGKAGAKADGFEGVTVHRESFGGASRNRTGVAGFAVQSVTTPPSRRKASVNSIQAHMRLEGIPAVGCSLPEAIFAIDAIFDDEPFDEADVDNLTDFPALLGTRRNITIESAPTSDPPSAITIPCHFHSPVSGGARPRVDEYEMGPLGLMVNRKSYSVRRKMTKLAIDWVSHDRSAARRWPRQAHSQIFFQQGRG